jgi:hypothetical protein
VADLTVTPANVVSGASAQFLTGTAGASVTAGQPVYLDTGTNTYKPADANASAATAVVAGVALHGATTGQPLKIQTAGVLAFGAILTVGVIYVLSSNAGGIAPAADLAAGWYTSILGVATTTGNLTLGLNNSGVAN